MVTPKLLFQVKFSPLKILLLLAWRLPFHMSRIFRNDFLILAAETNVNIISLEVEFKRLADCSQILKQLGCQHTNFTHLGCYSESIKSFTGYYENILPSVSLCILGGGT